jgi:hypothetical protein
MAPKKLKLWQHSNAKKALNDDIIKKKVTDGMTALEVYNSRLDCQAYSFAKFEEYLTNLRAAIQKKQGYADRDAAALAHNLPLRPERKTLHWGGSNAQKLLQEDIDSGLHTSKTPRELWGTRSEYQEFDAKKFQKHLNQERNAKLAKSFRMYNQEKKSKRLFL